MEEIWGGGQMVERILLSACVCIPTAPAYTGGSTLQHDGKQSTWLHVHETVTHPSCSIPLSLQQRNGTLTLLNLTLFKLILIRKKQKTDTLTIPLC